MSGHHLLMSKKARNARCGFGFRPIGKRLYGLSGLAFVFAKLMRS